MADEGFYYAEGRFYILNVGIRDFQAVVVSEIGRRYKSSGVDLIASFLIFFIRWNLALRKIWNGSDNRCSPLKNTN